jgi:hypothetical protein
MLSSKTRITSDHTDKNYLIRLADFSMCWLALCGLANVAFGAVSITRGGRLALFGQYLVTPKQKCLWIGWYLAVSSCGFLYMWWRQGWHYRLSELVKLVTFCCVLFAVFQLDFAARQFAFAGTGFFVFLYSISWSRRQRLGFTKPTAPK